MDLVLKQLGELLLGSIPTILFLLALFGIYNFLVHRPLVRMLAERRNRTEGAVERARADVAKAEARTAEYEQRLREARMAVFKSQEARRQQAQQVRATVVAEARTKAQAEIDQARAAIEKDKQAAQAGLEGESRQLANEIVRTVLQPAMAQSPAGGR